MKVTLDEHGICLADVAVESYAKHAIDNNLNIHVSNMLIIEALRYTLHKMPMDKWPSIEWSIYGKEVIFDKDLKSFDAWSDPRADLISKFLMELL